MKKVHIKNINKLIELREVLDKKLYSGHAFPSSFSSTDHLDDLGHLQVLEDLLRRLIARISTLVAK
jgi:hypothetical protein